MSVAKILSLLPTAQGTLQQRSGGVTGPLDRNVGETCIENFQKFEKRAWTAHMAHLANSIRF